MIDDVCRRIVSDMKRGHIGLKSARSISSFWSEISFQPVCLIVGYPICTISFRKCYPMISGSSPMVEDGSNSLFCLVDSEPSEIFSFFPPFFFKGCYFVVMMFLIHFLMTVEILPPFRTIEQTAKNHAILYRNFAFCWYCCYCCCCCCCRCCCYLCADSTTGINGFGFGAKNPHLSMTSFVCTVKKGFRFVSSVRS